MFSMAMTAWSANAHTRSIWRSVNGSTSLPRKANDTNWLALAEQWHSDLGMDPYHRVVACARVYSGSRRHLNDMHRSSF